MGAEDGQGSRGAAAVSDGVSRSGLDRRRVLGAAIGFVDRNGLKALTMRRLGAELGVEAMALYRYVPSREALLDGVAEAVIDELYGDPDVFLEASAGWQDYLQRLAHGLRRIALAHPQVFPLVATRPTAAPWVRPPLRSLRWIESLLTALTSSGFSDRAAATAYKAYSSFLLGHLLLEVAGLGVDTGPIEQDDDDAGPGVDESVGQYPVVARLQPLLSLDTSADDFEEALRALVDRIELLGRPRP